MKHFDKASFFLNYDFISLLGEPTRKFVEKNALKQPPPTKKKKRSGGRKSRNKRMWQKKKRKNSQLFSQDKETPSEMVSDRETRPDTWESQ